MFYFFFSFFFLGGLRGVLGTVSWFLGVDGVRIPLIVLSCWLLPLTLLASQGHMERSSFFRQRFYSSLLVFVLVCLLITFSSLELSLFYISFEASLLPILVIISKWGSQYDRYQAGVYFMFYTLVGSLPFLVSLFSIKIFVGSLFFPIFNYFFVFEYSFGRSTVLWWFFTFLVFCG